MDFFNDIVETLQALVDALREGLGDCFQTKQIITHHNDKSSPEPIFKPTIQKHLIHHLVVPP